jgi:hypothetical protein
MFFITSKNMIAILHQIEPPVKLKLTGSAAVNYNKLVAAGQGSGSKIL